MHCPQPRRAARRRLAVLVAVAVAGVLPTPARAAHATRIRLADIASWGYDYTLTADGRYLLFSARRTSDTAYQVFVWRVGAPTAELVSQTADGTPADRDVRARDISDDGRYVVLTTNATNLVTKDTNGLEDVFLHDRTTRATRRVSMTSTGGQLSQGSSTGSGSLLAGNGSVVLFSSRERVIAGLGAPGDYARLTMGTVYAYDVRTQRITLATPQARGTFVDVMTFEADGDGRKIGFVTDDPLRPQDRDIANDIYTRDLRTGGVTLVTGLPAEDGATLDQGIGRFWMSSDATKFVHTANVEHPKTATVFRDVRAGVTRDLRPDPELGYGATQLGIVAFSADGAYALLDAVTAKSPPDPGAPATRTPVWLVSTRDGSHVRVHSEVSDACEAAVTMDGGANGALSSTASTVVFTQYMLCDSVAKPTPAGSLPYLLKR